MLSIDLSMANRNQPMLHIDIASDVEFRPSTETLDPKITQLIMHLKSLQKDIKDYSKRFNELLKPFVQEEDAVKGNLNEFPKSLKDIGANREGTEKGNEELKNDGDVGKRFLAKVMEACREMMESDSLHDQGGELTANTEDISTNIEGLEEDLREMIAASIGEADEPFERTMRALMRECKERRKKDRNDGKMSLMECKEEFGVSRKENRALIVRKARSFEVRINMSQLLVDLVFMMSGKEEFEAKIERLKSTLKLVSTEDENSMVINKIGTLLEQAKRNEPMKGKWAGLEQTGLDESNQEESSNKRSRAEDLFDQFRKKILHLLLDQFLELALHLECIMSHPHHPKTEN